MSDNEADRDLAWSISTFIKEMPATQAFPVPAPAHELVPSAKPLDVNPRRRIRGQASPAELLRG